MTPPRVLPAEDENGMEVERHESDSDDDAEPVDEEDSSGSPGFAMTLGVPLPDRAGDLKRKRSQDDSGGMSEEDEEDEDEDPVEVDRQAFDSDEEDPPKRRKVGSTIHVARGVQNVRARQALYGFAMKFEPMPEWGYTEVTFECIDARWFNGHRNAELDAYWDDFWAMPVVASPWWRVPTG